jgi:hypothetical protein
MLLSLAWPILVGCGISVFMHMFFVLMVLFIHPIHSNTVPEPEETTILVYAQEVLPPLRRTPPILPLWKIVPSIYQFKLILSCSP